MYEDGIVLEGKQAEEYKARKAKEKRDEDTREDKRRIRRDINISRKGGSAREHERLSAGVDSAQEQYNRARNLRKASKRAANYGMQLPVGSALYKKANNEYDRAEHNYYNNQNYLRRYGNRALDAIERDKRRHPEKYANKKYVESTIFSDIDII